MAPIPNVNIASSEFKANPFPFYARLRSEAPVYRTKLPDKRSVWLVTRYQDVVALLKDDRFSKDEMTAQELPWIPSMFKPLMRNMLDLDAPDHTRLRGLVQIAFVPRLIENLGQRVQALADELLNRVQLLGRMDLIHDCALQIPTTIIAEMLGVPQKDRLKFHRWSSGAISASASRLGILAAIPHMMALWLSMVPAICKKSLTQETSRPALGHDMRKRDAKRQDERDRDLTPLSRRWEGVRSKNSWWLFPLVWRGSVRLSSLTSALRSFAIATLTAGSKSPKLSFL